MSKLKSKTMYMHTLDGKPASFAWTKERRGEKTVNVPYIYFASARHPARLLNTLRGIRMQQRWTMNEAARYANSTAGAHWADPKHYGYVRVEVPADVR